MQAGSDDGAHGVEPEDERRRDAEVPAATVQRPEQVGVLVGAGGDLAAVGGDEVDRDQAVAAESERPFEPSRAAAQRQAGDARGRHAPAGGRQPVLLGCPIELAPRHPGADPHLPTVGVDLDRLHRTDVDDEPAVVEAHTRHRVPARADGHLVDLAWRASVSASTTSVAVAHVAITAGRLSIMALKIVRASS